MRTRHRHPSIVEVSALVRDQKVSPRELVRQCLERTNELNPAINAFITVLSEEALEAAEQAEREIAAAAPKWVQWQTKAGKRLGSGSAVFKVPSGVSQIVALDTRRGGRTLIDVGDGAADWSKLAHGKLQLRAATFADVFLGSEALGTTPFASVDLVVGSYVVTFRHDGKEKTERVEIKAGQLTKASATFE